MLKNRKLLKKTEKNFILKEKLNYEKSLKLFEEIWKYAKEIGVLPSENSLEGIDVDIKVSRIINTCLKD
jgi:prephenate dehydratase